MVGIAAICAVAAESAQANHVAREDPPEPIFTQRSFLERNVELDLGVAHDVDDANVQETTVAASWVFAKRFQLGVELPYAVVMPESGSARSAFSDMSVSTQVLLCCEEKFGWRFLSVRAEVDPPTGDLARGIGGNGGFSFSLLGGKAFTVVESLEDLGVQVELAYGQEIGLTDDENESAARLGRPHIRGKQVDWNVAVTQPFFGNRLTPVVELLGTSVVDAVDPHDEGTEVDLSVGVWIAPFADDSRFSAISVGAGWRLPVTGRREADGQGLMIFEWTFD
jgi:hypothetical protein